jgi:hypothetical protein
VATPGGHCAFLSRREVDHPNRQFLREVADYCAAINFVPRSINRPDLLGLHQDRVVLKDNDMMQLRKTAPYSSFDGGIDMGWRYVI